MRGYTKTHIGAKLTASAAPFQLESQGRSSVQKRRARRTLRGAAGEFRFAAEIDRQALKHVF
jgi:hypothetical protein